jgi:hypothetical protein
VSDLFRSLPNQFCIPCSIVNIQVYLLAYSTPPFSSHVNKKPEWTWNWKRLLYVIVSFQSPLILKMFYDLFH